MKKGFIGPLGDDLPSLIAIMLALTLFFSGLTFAMQTFNTKQSKVRLMKGAIDIGRVLTKEPVLPQKPETLRDKYEAISIAENNGLDFYLDYSSEKLEVKDDECGEHAIHFSYLVSRQKNTEIVVDTLRICVWEAEK